MLVFASPKRSNWAEKTDPDNRHRKRRVIAGFAPERLPVHAVSMIRLIPTLPSIYVIVRVVWPLPWPLAAKIIVVLFLLAASQYHQWSRLSSGSVFAPEFPRPLVMLFNVAFGGIALLAVMQIVADIVVLASTALPAGGWAISAEWRYAEAVIAILLAAYGVQQASRIPPLKEIEVPIEDLPPSFAGCTILHLTDLHISRLFPASWVRAVVDRSNDLSADVIAISGDLIDGSIEMRRADLEPLRGLQAQDGVWVVSGNHENIFGYDTWMRHYEDLGMHVLANAHTVLKRGGGKLVLAGVNDRSAPSWHEAADPLPRGDRHAPGRSDLP